MGLIRKLYDLVAFSCDDFRGFTPSHDDNLLLSHNQKVYNKIVKGFSKSNKVLVVQATGTGKSYLILKLLKDHAIGKRVLYITPTSAIESYFVDDVLKEYMPNYKEQMEFTSCLFPSVKKFVNEKFDIIIIDEVHHVGAKEWGKAIDNLLINNPQASVLGVTATLERQDGIDVTKFFENHKPVSTITLIDAMQQGILQAPDYVLGKIDFGQDIEYIDKSIKELQEELKTASEADKQKIKQFLVDLKHAKHMISETKQIPQTIKEKLNTEKLKNGKYIVFCPAGLNDSEDDTSEMKMEQTMSQAKDWFGSVNSDIRQYAIHSLYGNKHNKQALKEFQADNKPGLKLMFTVNMLNEGLHAGDIDGVILLRPTSSQTIYTQQIGRALSAKSHTHQRLIFDFVANLQSIDANQIKEMADKVNAGSNKDFDNTNDETYSDGNDIIQKFNLKIENLETIQFIEELKKNLSTFDDRFDFEFEDFYNRLVIYKAEFGDLLVPQGYVKDGYKLGQKVSSIRSGAIKLNKEQIQRLNEIGFVWIVREGFDFEKFYALLVIYKEKHGNLLVPVDFVCDENGNELDEDDENGYKLGQKVAAVRIGAKQSKEGKRHLGIKLDKEQKQRLDEIGFVWIVREGFDFEKFYALLVIYKEKHGNLLVPVDFVCDENGNELDEDDENGYKLGQKVAAVRIGAKQSKEGKRHLGIKLDKEQKQRLDEIGFIWAVREAEFEKFYALLVIYKEKNGNLLVPKSFVCDENGNELKKGDKNGYKLGKKVSDTRQRKDRLNKEQKQRLDEIGFVWDVKEYLKENSTGDTIK